ncbi:bacteriohemerythrin [Candidatus Riflebacteria bacterium]
MALVEWEDYFSVKVEHLDNEHKLLFGLINRLHDGISEGKEQEVMLPILIELGDYTKFHFSNEENYLKKYDFPDLDKHVIQHEIFIKKILDFQNEFLKKKPHMAIDILCFLNEWFINHVTRADQQYSKFLIEKGIL